MQLDDRAAHLDTLGWVHFRRGELDEALLYLEQAYEQQSDDSDIVTHLLELYQRLGMTDEAQRLRQRLRQLRPAERLPRPHINDEDA